MKRFLLLAIVCTVPVLLFLNAWQVFRFNKVLREVRSLEVEQRELIDENIKTLVGMEVLSSPSRIVNIMDDLEGVEKRTGAPRLLIRVGEEGEGAR